MVDIVKISELDPSGPLGGNEVMPGVQAGVNVGITPAAVALLASVAPEEPADTLEDCLVITTANITLTGEQTIDGELTDESRVLVNAQDDPTENGVYVSAAGAWSRATDADAGGEFTPRIEVFISNGATNGQTLWFLLNSGTITVGTTPIKFKQKLSLGYTQNKLVQAEEYTLIRSDVGKRINMDWETANKVIVPAHEDVPFPRDAVIEVQWVGAGQTTIEAAPGVEIKTPQGLHLLRRRTVVQLKKRSQNVWDLAWLADFFFDNLSIGDAEMDGDDNLTLELHHNGKRLQMDNTVPNTVTVPAFADVPFDRNSEILVLQLGTGQTSIVAAPGVTILTGIGLDIPYQYGELKLKNHAVDTWVLNGPASTGDAEGASYTPDDTGDWPGSDPEDVAEALDMLAGRVTDLEGAGGGGDASDITYTPSTLANWPGSSDPGDVDGALDQLAARVTGLEVNLPFAAPGTKTYAILTPMDSFPTPSNAATLDTLANGLPCLDFDGGSTNEAIRWVRVMPEGASLGSGLKFTIKFTTSAATSGNVRWGVRVMRLNADISVDGFDTAAEDHVAVSGDVDDPAEITITLTTIDSIVAHDAYMIEVYRDASDTSNDTATGDAELISVEVWSAG